MSSQKTFSIELEAPPSGSSEGADLFGEDRLTNLAAKLMAAQQLLNLPLRPISFREFIREVLLIFLKSVPSEAGSVLEVHEEKGSIFFRAATGHSSDKIEHFLIPIGKGIVGHVIESKKFVNVKNVSENKEHLHSIGKAVGFETRNMIAFPILIRGKVYGVIELLNRMGETDFTPQDIDLIESLSEMAATAIELRMTLNSFNQPRQGKR